MIIDRKIYEIVDKIDDCDVFDKYDRDILVFNDNYKEMLLGGFIKAFNEEPHYKSYDDDYEIYSEIDISLENYYL